MPIQTFTDPEKAILKNAEAQIFAQEGAIEDQLNRTKAEQKSFFSDQLDLKIAQCQATLDNIDTMVAGIKAQMQAECNAKIALLNGLKTKIQNLPE